MIQVNAITNVDANNPIDMDDEVKNYKKNLIVAGLVECNGVKQQAARILGIQRTNLVERMKILKLSVKRENGVTSVQEGA